MASKVPNIHRLDFWMKNSGPTVQKLLNSGINLYHTQQQDGEVIVTVPKYLHAVYNFGVGFATAQNFIYEEIFTELRHHLDLVNSSPDARDDRQLQHVFMEADLTGLKKTTDGFRRKCNFRQ